jgi:kynureninase
MRAITLDEARELDKRDVLAPRRETFALPEGVIYLDGNSLGPLPRVTPARVAQVVEAEWGRGLIRSWEQAGWLEAQARIGGKIGRIVGATPGEMVVADSTSVNLFKLMVAGARLRPGRRTILMEAGDFPTDRHMAEAAARVLPGVAVQAVGREDVVRAIDATASVVVLCHVHYRTGARWDMAAVQAAAHAAGALVVWDLSHSAGALAVDLDACGADLAVGCGYKFLNGGPGAPAFLYVARRLWGEIETPLPGWFGHRAPFAFSDAYAGAEGAAQFQCGTAPILGLAALEAGVDVFLGVDRQAVFAKSAALFDMFAAQAACHCPALALITPGAAAARGSHIAFAHPQAQAIMSGLAASGVIGDYRPPDVLRFGLTPLYVGFEDVWRAVSALAGLEKGWGGCAIPPRPPVIF